MISGFSIEVLLDELPEFLLLRIVQRDCRLSGRGNGSGECQRGEDFRAEWP
jgi:hypothetical protein